MNLGTLPPLRHPSWLIVLTIALCGGSLTALMGGSAALSTALLTAAVVCGLITRRYTRCRHS
jgi:uncharacterized membrane protein YjjP (DUF1212 family)